VIVFAYNLGIPPDVSNDRLSARAGDHPKVSRMNMLRLLSVHVPVFQQKIQNRLNPMFWWFGAMATPVPIPNTEVKRSCGDDSPLGESS
jgi:hypothetical protein